MTHWSNTLQICKDYISTLSHKPYNYSISVENENCLWVHAAPGVSLHVFTEENRLTEGSQEKLKRLFYSNRKLN